MSYFTDLTPHTYTPTGDTKVLNVGWLDIAFAYPIGSTSLTFRDALLRLCGRPIHLHRGFHSCQFCEAERSAPSNSLNAERFGNGQIRVLGVDGIWYAAPTMIHHYVTVHGYQPPAVFIEAVLRG